MFNSSGLSLHFFLNVYVFLKEPDMGAIARKEVENYTKAKDRYQDALKELKSQRLKDHERQNR